MYGTTYEPVVFIYNKRLIPQGDVPDSHAALAKLIAGQTDKFKKKVTTYDIEKSGVGFMLSVQDFKADPNYFKTLADVAKGGLAVQSSTGTMMERVSSGENLIGFNILGSYAEARAKSDPSLGIVYPKDYTLVLSRVSFISKEAGNPNAAKLWFDYVLSEKGQNILANQADIPSIRNDIEGKNDIDGMTKLLGNALKPIPVDDSLLEYLQPAKRLDYIKQWRRRGEITGTAFGRAPALAARALWSAFTTIGSIYASMAQKVAEPAARPGGVDNRTGYLCPLSFIIIQSFLSAPFFSPPRSSAWRPSSSSLPILISTRR